MNVQDNNRLETVERLLRARGPAALSPGFKRDVLAAIARLPEPQLMRPARSWRTVLRFLRGLSTGERVGLALLIIAAPALLIPAVGDLLLLATWELADVSVSLSIGETALSASLLSVSALAVGAAFLAGVGAYATRQHLLGT